MKPFLPYKKRNFSAMQSSFLTAEQHFAVQRLQQLPLYQAQTVAIYQRQQAHPLDLSKSSLSPSLESGSGDSSPEYKTNVPPPFPYVPANLFLYNSSQINGGGSISSNGSSHSQQQLQLSPTYKTEFSPVDASASSSTAIEPTIDENGRPIYKCTDCTHTFHQPERLKAHQRRHKIKQSGRYTCHLCNKSFVQQSSLITHTRIHTGERPYHCKTCQNSYGDLSTFTKHRRTHSGEKPYVCTICDRRFSQSGNCLRHTRSVHASKAKKGFKNLNFPTL